jgi:hypothetical protein
MIPVAPTAGDALADTAQQVHATHRGKGSRTLAIAGLFRYNARALVNKGNCHVVASQAKGDRHELEKAKELYAPHWDIAAAAPQ